MAKHRDLTEQTLERLPVVGDSNNKKLCEPIIDKHIADKPRRKGPREIRDLTNQRFGKLVAKYPTDKRLGSSVVWCCDCDCGESCEVASHNLLAKTTRSCGCIKGETSKDSIGIAYKAFSDKNHKEGTNLALISSNKSLGGKSKYRGVSYDDKKEKWYAYIKFRGERHFLGYFLEEEDAHDARLVAENTLYKPIIDKYASDGADEKDKEV